MFLALRDLRAARGRFALMGGTVALVTVLLVLLSGLAEGLVDDGVSGLDALPATHLVFAEGAEATFSRSTVTHGALDALPRGLDATLLGVTFVNARTGDDVAIDVALFGVDAEGFLAPEPTTGEPLVADRGSVVLDASTAAEEGIDIGERLQLAGAGEVELTVAGFSDAGTYGHVPIAFTSLSMWRAAQFGDAGREAASAIALDTADAPPPPEGLEILTREEAFAGSPGFVAEQSTLSLIQWFLYVISALVVGAFFTVWTIQRTRDVGVLKALGARSSYVIRDALAQALIVLLVATAIGTAVGAIVGTLLGAGPAPFLLRPTALAGGIALLLGFAVLGAGVALRRITRVDPLIALGADR